MIRPAEAMEAVGTALLVRSPVPWKPMFTATLVSCENNDMWKVKVVACSLEMIGSPDRTYTHHGMSRRTGCIYIRPWQAIVIGQEDLVGDQTELLDKFILLYR